MLTTTITAPMAGILIIDAAVGLSRHVSATNNPSCNVAIDQSRILGAGSVVEVGSNRSFDTCNASGAAVVTAGSHDVDFDITIISPGTTVDQGSLTVLFVPFDANGQTPTP